MLIPKDNKYRLIDELIDFSFVYDELKDKYCPDNGRTAADPIMLFKYLMIKAIENLSDVDVVEHSRYDLSYKRFLGLMPEDDVIEPSLLTKFRRLRLKDVNLLDMLIGKTVGVALEKGISRANALSLNVKSPKNIAENLVFTAKALMSCSVFYIEEESFLYGA